MKIPHPSDPGGNYEGELRRSTVLDVLFKNGVTVKPIGDDGTAQLEKDEILEVHEMPETIGGKMINYLGRKFGIPPETFYQSVKNIH